MEDLTTEGYAALLRIERGRVHRREIFGPVRLHYGFFKLQANRSHYLIAREDGRIAGAVGFMHDPVHKTVRIFELIALEDDVIRFLLENLERSCREDWGICCIEVDVSAYAPRMQRTLVELGFLPVSYLPALAFDQVERLDIVKMIRLLIRPEINTEGLTPAAKAVADLVLRRFRSRSVLPRIAEAVRDLSLFAGLDEEQIQRLAGACTLATFEPGQIVFQAEHPGREMYLVLRGEVEIASPRCSAPRRRRADGRMPGRDLLADRSRPLGDGHRSDARRDGRPEPSRSRRADPAPPGHRASHLPQPGHRPG